MLQITIKTFLPQGSMYQTSSFVHFQGLKFITQFNKKNSSYTGIFGMDLLKKKI